ncbi:MAG: PQQ-dependent dehydrogenase, methanol/ethanol family [Caulobacterales bacterium]|nr:PQQ-dependent dehydrogenase, methanol/ethanol family [Caulobacterales bacterium]
MVKDVFGALTASAARAALMWCAVVIAACAPVDRAPSSSGESWASATPSGEDEGEWLLHGLSGGEQRHSPLSQINAGTVDRLGLAFEYRDFVVRGRTHRGAQATPLMDDGVLYFTGPWSVVYAVDARTGEGLWVFDPEVDGARARVTCCDVVNRGVALKGDRLFVATIDGFLIALDKATGAPAWRSDTLIARDMPYTITGAPRLAGDLVVIGNGGAEMGVRGYVSAYDAATGELVWRFFTVPGAGPDETIDVSRARETWSEETPWAFGGGGTVWDSMVYDAELGALFIGVGNGAPWPAWERGRGERRDNLYLSSIVALDAATGRARWHYQTTPGDSWDYTATQHMILADIDWEGAPRKVVMQAPKNGFFYVLDRETGELLAADPYVPLNWASHVDLETGRPVLTENADYSKSAKVIRPSPGGGHNWPPMAFNPDTGLVYIPAIEYASKLTSFDDGLGHLPGSRNTLALSAIPDPERDRDLLDGQADVTPLSRLIAWDPVAGRAAWRSEPLSVWAGGVLSTAGGLVVLGGSDGALMVYDAATGERLKVIDVGTTMTAPPIAYELDGRQHIAVLAGLGGVVLRAYAPSFAAAKHESFERLLVFTLDGGPTPKPPAKEAAPTNAIAEGLPDDAATLALGETQYRRHCVRCHATGNALSGYPDLWNMAASTEEAFDQIVLDGAYAYAGMAGFADVLTPDDTLAIRAYIAADRRAAAGEARPDGFQVH